MTADLRFRHAAIDRFASLAGWRRAGAAILLGAAAAAAQPPLHALPLLVVAFTGLVWLLDGAATGRRAFHDGWLFGAGYFGAGLYWVSNALLVDAARFGWLIPFALLGLSFGLGLFGGVAALLARLAQGGGAARVLGLAAAWTGVEWLRGVVLTGFPWNPAGNVWVASDAMLQPAAWIGVYGLGMVTVFAAASPALLADRRRRTWIVPAAAGVLLCALFAGGAARLAASPVRYADGIVLRIVQPDIAQRDKWRPELRAANFRLMIDLSRAPPAAGTGPVTHVIWPETAAPFPVADDADGRALLRPAVPPGGLLITGAARFAFAGGRLTAAWNGLVAVDGSGAVAGTYDKHHLVPFGEYVPFRTVLPLDKITAGAVDFSPGPGLRTLKLPGLPPFSPLICYEAIFPGRVADADDRPTWLLNLTNDAWFGDSAGPRQHFASARLRAVEEGLPLIRAANTGISSVIGPNGRILARLSLGRRGVLDSRLPLPRSTPTFFGRYGNLVPGALVVAGYAGALLRRRERIR